MSAAPLQVPDKVRRKAVSMGEAGRVWLENLPTQIAELERRWAIKVGQPAQNGTEAFVAEAHTDDGQDVMVKIKIPGIDPLRLEPRILRIASGIGYAKLIREDEIAGVMLLERLGPQLHAYHLPEETQLKIICTTLRSAWMPLADGTPFPTGADKAVELSRAIESLWGLLAPPCSERTVELALLYAEKRRHAFEPTQSVLLHGDAHQWNTLAASGSVTGFKFIDPEGVFAECAFDLAISMREWGVVMPEGDPAQRGRDRCRSLSEFTGVACQPIWEWALIQCLSNGLLLQQIGMREPASVSLAMADAWAASGDFAGS